MIHSFDIELAQEFGLDEAIMISNFQFWISKNLANGRHEYEGRFWTYNSIPAFVKIFPYWTEKQVRRILDSLVVQGVLIKGNHGKNGYDRTLWYAFLDESKFLKRQNDMPKWADGSAETGNCITDNNTIGFTDNNTDNSGFQKSIESKEQFEKFRKEYPGQKRGFETEFKTFQKHKDWKEVLPLLSENLKKQIEIRNAKLARKEFVPEWPMLSTYLNQRRWEIVPDIAPDVFHMINSAHTNRFPVSDAMRRGFNKNNQ